MSLATCALTAHSYPSIFSSKELQELAVINASALLLFSLLLLASI